MELQGKIIAAMPEKSGVSARGEWKAQSFVMEMFDSNSQYPRRMVFDVFGADRLAQFNIQVGDVKKVSFDIDAHEYQGRWFNSIRAWRVESVDPSAMAQGIAQQPASPFPPAGAVPAGGSTAPFPPAPAAGAVADNSADDLPF